MAIGPMDIHHKEFGTVRVGGYNKEEVDAFLDMVADELERLLHRNQEQTELLESMRQKASQFDSMQQTLQNAIINAQKSADNIVQEARIQAEAMLKDAQEQSLRILEEARAERSRISQSFVGIREQVINYIATIKELLEKNQAMIKDYETRLSATELREEAASMAAQPIPVVSPQPETPSAVEPETIDTGPETKIPRSPVDAYVSPPPPAQQVEAPPVPEPDFARYREASEETPPGPYPRSQAMPAEPSSAPLLESTTTPYSQGAESAAPPSDFAASRPQTVPEVIPEPEPAPRPRQPLITPEQEMELMRRSMEQEPAPVEPEPPVGGPEASEKHFFWE